MSSANPFAMSITQEDWDIIKLLLKIGAVGTAASIPVGWWAIKKWPDSPWIPAVILTGLGFIIKELMISHGEEEEPLMEDLHAALPALPAAAQANMGAWPPPAPLFFG